MIPLNFYRDDEYVYYNNPNGITKKMTIADFESVMSGGGYDIIIDGGDDITEATENTCTVVKFDVAEVQRKIQSGTPVNGIFIIHYNYDADVEGDTDMELTPLRGVGVYSERCVLNFYDVNMYAKSGKYLDIYATSVSISTDLQGSILEEGVTYHRFNESVAIK